MDNDGNKHFDKWATRKKELDKSSNVQKFINPREIWWVEYGENIGSELCGKNTNNQNFERPVIVIKKLGNCYLVLPLTSKKPKSNYLKVQENSFVLVSQFNIISRARFVRKPKTGNKISPILFEQIIALIIQDFEVVSDKEKFKKVIPQKN